MGPNAGEVTQGFAALVLKGAYKEDLDTSSPPVNTSRVKEKERSFTGPYIKNDFNVNKIER